MGDLVTRVFELLREVLLPAVGLAVSSLLYFEIVAWKSRKAGMALCGNRSDWSYLLSCLGMWYMEVVFTFPLLMSGSPDSPYARTAMSILGAAMVVVLAGSFWEMWRSYDRPKSRYLTSGELFEGVSALRLKANLSMRFRVYVIPDGFRDEPGSIWSRGEGRVLVPQRLIEWMSRAEIDALLAFDMVRTERIQPLRRIYRASFGCGMAVWAVLVLLNVSRQGRWAAFLILLAANLIALHAQLPRMLRAEGPGPIEAGGDPEAFCSAMAELTRLDGGVVTARVAQRIGRMAGVAPERVLALPPQTRPALDRYPSSGGAEGSWF